MQQTGVDGLAAFLALCVAGIIVVLSMIWGFNQMEAADRSDQAAAKAAHQAAWKARRGAVLQVSDVKGSYERVSGSRVSGAANPFRVATVRYRDWQGRQHTKQWLLNWRVGADSRQPLWVNQTGRVLLRDDIERTEPLPPEWASYVDDKTNALWVMVGLFGGLVAAAFGGILAYLAVHSLLWPFTRSSLRPSHDS